MVKGVTSDLYVTSQWQEPFRQWRPSFLAVPGTCSSQMPPGSRATAAAPGLLGGPHQLGVRSGHRRRFKGRFGDHAAIVFGVLRLFLDETNTTPPRIPGTRPDHLPTRQTVINVEQRREVPGVLERAHLGKAHLIGTARAGQPRRTAPTAAFRTSVHATRTPVGFTLAPPLLVSLMRPPLLAHP